MSAAGLAQANLRAFREEVEHMGYGPRGVAAILKLELERAEASA